MVDISFCLFTLVALHCIDNGNSFNNSDNLNLQESSFEYHDETPKFPLRKCYCGANNIWEKGKCVPLRTGVDFILSFAPPILKKHVDTSDFRTVIVNKTHCDESMIPLTIKNIAFTMQENGVIFHFTSGENFSNYYCVEHVKNDSGTVVLQAEICLPKIEVPQCCPENGFFNSSSYKCDLGSNAVLFHPQVHFGDIEISSPNIIPFLNEIPSCHHNFLERKLLNFEDRLTLQYQQAEVTLAEWNDIPHQSFPERFVFPAEYCIAIERNNQRSIYTAMIWNIDQINNCSNVSSDFEDDFFDQCDKIMDGLLLMLLSLSSLFLLLILVLHAVMPELRKSLGSKITICHVASLFCGFCLLLLLHGPHQFNCKIYGPLIQMTFLATFFWLNVMCFDIWWKLRCRSPAGETIQSSRAQFIRYSFYAWGTPMLVGLVTVIMDNIPSLEGVPGIVVPGFGKKHCWFVDTSATLWYYFGIIAVLMAANTFFFVWVFVILFRANCTYRKVLKNNQKSNANRTWVYLKIFGVMGITWVCEFLSWKEGTCRYWVITDIINSLRGLVLFIIFFGNRKSVNKIRQKFQTMNRSFHTQVSRSVLSLRKLSWKAPGATGATVGTVETVLESQKTSEVNAEYSNRAITLENETEQ